MNSSSMESSKGKSIKSRLLAVILCIAFGFSAVLFAASMYTLVRQRDRITQVSNKTEVNVSNQTEISMEELEKNMADDIADASLAFFDERFSVVQKHAESIARRAGELYRENKPVAEPDGKVGIVAGISPESVSEEFSVIAPLREFIAFLPSYDVGNLAALDLYYMTDSGMCFDGTFDDLGNNYADLRLEEWYQQARDSGDIFWTGIFRGKVTNSIKVVCSVPVYDGDGNFKGAASGDVAVATFRDIIDSFDVEEVKSILFFDRFNNLMYATNSQEDSNEIRKNLTMGVDYADTDDYIYCFRRMSDTGWTLCFEISKEAVNRTVGEIERSISANTASVQGEIYSSIRRCILIFLIVLVLGGTLVIFITNAQSAKIVKPLQELSNDAEVIGSGNLDIVIPVNSNDEIGRLSSSFNKMAGDLKQYIEDFTKATRENERIASELNVATQIQVDMLPKLYPFTRNKEFSIFASMNPAKEVGGDFYDFFRIDETRLALVIADVSGKGVPAALFMVIAKTLIKNRAITGGNPSEILSYVNNQLLENNDAGMFVTAWLGILDLKTGVMTASNAGHEFPVIGKAGRPFELVYDRHGLVLAAMEGTRYRDYTLQLEPGDKLFVYTDGVPEATNAQNELFGTDRLIEAMNSRSFSSCEQMISDVSQAIDRFVKDAPQFDDITMLCFDFKEYYEQP